MERVVELRLRLSYERAALRPWLVAALLVACAGELASESVTLTTYYPAPMGVYTQMITTNNSFFARDAGKVLLGGTVLSNGANLDGGAKLDVTGSAYMQKMLTTGNNGPNAADPKAADIVVGSDAGTRHDGSIMFWSAASASRIFNQADVFYLSTWNQNAVTGANIALAATLGGSSRIQGNLGIGSTTPWGTNRGYLYIDNTNSGCVEVNVTQGSICGGGTYASFMPGLYVEGWSYANRGGQVLVESQAGATSTQVWGLDNGAGGTGNPRWMTLKKDDSIAHVFCCPR